MPVLEMLIGAILEMGVEGTWESVKRREAVIKLLKRFKLDPDNPPKDFEGIYAYTLVEYGVLKPRPVLMFFRNEFIQEAYKKAFHENDPSILDREADGIIQWSDETGKLGRIDYDPRHEFAAFTLVFNKLVSYSRTPAEARREHKLDQLLEEVKKINDKEVVGLPENGQVSLSNKLPKQTEWSFPDPDGSKQLRWLHLSDFHVGKDNYGNRRMFKHILDHVQERVTQGLAPDMVFITGDIADKGKEEEYDEFYEKFYLPLHESLPAKSENNIFLVPGNHDVDWTQVRAVQTYDLLSRIPEFLDPTNEGQFERNAILPRFRAFVESDLTSEQQEHWLNSAKGTFYKKISVKDFTIGIIGLNTAWFSSSDADRHQLSAGKYLLEDALENIGDCDLKFVLGHHPLDWLLDEDLAPMRVVLGKHEAVYLHGHLHKGKGYYDEGAGYPFLTLQAGASFQSRSDEKWVNRLLWSQLDMESRGVWLEPLQWAVDNLEWKLDTTAFPEHYRQGGYWRIPLPKQYEEANKGGTPVATLSEVEKINPPNGWEVVDAAFLEKRRVNLEDDQVLSFFNGREPIWREALSKQIPRREAVGQIITKLKRAQEASEQSVTLITGAAGEGKTTVFLQAVTDLLLEDDSWKVLWHFKTITDLPSDFIVRLPKTDGVTWLVISDDAEIIAEDVYKAAQQLHARNRQDIQFLLCARDTDWIADNPHPMSLWQQHTLFQEIKLRSLSEADAQQLVDAWSPYKRLGLQNLYGLESSEAVEKLVNAAKSHESSNDGSFFGAMLEVRWGDKLLDHVEELLSNLEDRPIPGTDLTLLDALAYIAAPHAEDILVLPKMALAKVLKVSMNDLRNCVLTPLGEEAAIATSGHFVYTRHKSIARAVIAKGAQKFDIDRDALFVDLVSTIIGAYVNNWSNRLLQRYVRDWNFVSDYFFNRGEQDLGIKLAQAAVDADTEDPLFLVKLAHLYRIQGYPEIGSSLFYEFPKENGRHRAFFAEWGICERHAENHGLAAWLLGYSIADQASQENMKRKSRARMGYLDNERAQISLLALSNIFLELFEKYNRDEYLNAGNSAIELGLMLRLDDKEKAMFLQAKKRLKEYDIVKERTPAFALEQLQLGVTSAWERREIDLPEISDIPSADEFLFDELRRLLRVE